MIITLSASDTFGQKDLKKAEKLYEQGDYCSAISFFSRHLNAFVDRNALVRRGRSYYHCNQLDEAIQDFKDAQVLNYKKDDIEYFLAKAYQHKHDFESAIFHFKNYLSANLKNEYIRQRITDEIKRCARGINLQYSKTTVFVENMGPGINSLGNEINLIESPADPNRFYFSKSDHSNSSEYDILIYSFLESEYMENEYLNPGHSYFNEVINGITKDGQLLFFSRYDQRSKTNKLLVDRYVEGDEPLSNIHIFDGPIRYELGDRDFYIINDSLFLFSSKRLEGYGGYDLYITGYKNGNWFEPVNLGKSINTPYDEITPSMNPERTILYFSSDDTRSIGGFDVFRALYSTEEGSWMKKNNLGFPFNSAANDFNYKISSGGQRAFLTSDRKSDGYGGYDLYQVLLTEPDHSIPGNDIYSFVDQIETQTAYPRFSPKKRELEEEEPLANKPEVVLQSKEEEEDFERELEQLAMEATRSKKDTAMSNSRPEQLLLRPLFYQAGVPILELSNQRSFLESIVEALHANPGLSVRMTGHCSPGENIWTDQQKSIEILLALVKYMVDEGVAPDHIFVSGAGSSLPVARVNVSERLKTASDRFNNRVTFKFFGDDRVTVKHEAPFVVQHLKDDSWYLYQSIDEELSYKIEVEIENEDAFHQVIGVLPHCLVDMDIFTTRKKYYFGIFTRYKEARLSASAIGRETGCKTKVLPFVGGDLIDEKQVLDYAKEYTDLVNYLESLK